MPFGKYQEIASINKKALKKGGDQTTSITMSDGELICRVGQAANQGTFHELVVGFPHPFLRARLGKN